MNVFQKMTALADAIRLKTGGTAPLSLDDMAVAVADITSDKALIPNVHYAEAGRVTKALLDFKAAHPRSLMFGVMTDSHIYHADETYEAETVRSTRHAAFALETVGAAAGCDFIVNLGDNVWENGIDTDNAYAGNTVFNSLVKSAFDRLPSFRLVGNHDRSGNTQKSYDVIGVYNDFDAWGTTPIRGFGYKDLTDKKVRVICLNTTDYLNITGGQALSYDQKDFLLRALDLSDKTDAAAWQILLLSHIPLDSPNGNYNYTDDLAAILTAYVKGTAVRITVNNAYAVNEEPTAYATYQNGALVYDYSGKNAAKIIANVHGHQHTNMVAQMVGSEIWCVSVMNTCFSLNRPDGGDEGYKTPTADIEKLKKVAGTAADTSATFIGIDLDIGIVNVFTYGAGGADVTRTFVYGDTPSYAVAYALTNCTSSNMSTAVAEGSAYTTTLTVSNSEAVFDRISVTMGGVDITAEVVSDNTITIASVTGDIIIAAKASVPLLEYVVSDLAVAPRSTWTYYETSTPPFSFGNDNTRLAVGVTTANDFAFTDRESKPIYVMPIPAKASKVKLTNTDGVSYRYAFATFNVVDGLLVRVAESGWIDGTSYPFEAGSAAYITIIADTTDDSSVSWGYDDTNITVTFTNQ